MHRNAPPPTIASWHSLELPAPSSQHPSRRPSPLRSPQEALGEIHELAHLPLLPIGRIEVNAPSISDRRSCWFGFFFDRTKSFQEFTKSPFAARSARGAFVAVEETNGVGQRFDQITRPADFVIH